MQSLYDHELERQVLGILASMSEQSVSSASAAIDRLGLGAEDFHHQGHFIVFKAATEVLRKSPAESITPLSIKSHLKGLDALEDVGGWSWLVELLQGELVLMGHGIDAPAKLVKELAVRRRAMTILRKSVERIGDLQSPLVASVTDTTSALSGLQVAAGRFKQLPEVLDTIAGEIAQSQTGESRPVLPTGIRALDEVVGGLQPTLTVVGALPGVGKSALFATIVQNLAKTGIKVGLFSLEDEGTWLGWRLLSQEVGADQFVIRFKDHTDALHQRVGQGFAKLSQYGRNIIVDDRHGLTAPDIVQTARDMVINHGVEAILVDHLGEVRMRSAGADASAYALDVAEGLSDLRDIAKKHHVPVVVACHLNRKADEPDIAPRLSMFANAAAVERQARVALGLRRPAGGETLEIHILKNTNGVAGRVVKAKFVGAAAMIDSDWVLR